MKLSIAIVTGLVLGLGGTIQAAEPKQPRVVACQSFSTFKDPRGVELGVCGAKKAGGKVTYLGSFQVVTVVNPATARAERLMVGFAQ